MSSLFVALFALVASSFRTRVAPAGGDVERLIGSIRRECLDQIIVWNERSLRRARQSYFAYYNYASYCPPRYVVENSKPSCSDVGIAGSRLLRRTRSTNLAAASVSSARWLMTQGPSAR